MADPAWLSSGATSVSRELTPTGPTFKVILIGDAGVGKTAIFCRARHPGNAQGKTVSSATLGVDTCTRTICTRYGNVTLTLWDTAGVERYRTLTRNYYRSTHAALLVFSLDDAATLFSLSRWQRDVLESAPSAVQFLVGNKSDLDRQVSDSSIHSFADSHNCQAAFSTSAKTGEGLESALKAVCEHLIGNHQHYTDMCDSDKLWQQGSGLHVHGTENNGSKGCC